MAFNPDPPNKKVQEVVFSKKPLKSFYPNISFNKYMVEKVQTQRHLGLKLDKDQS